jgi:YVTN family beta-propeller protein
MPVFGTMAILEAEKEIPTKGWAVFVRFLSRYWFSMVCLALLPMLLSSLQGAAPPSVKNITVGSMPRTVAVNPVTNMIYVANYDSDTVTAINGANHTTATITVASGPQAVAVNPATNMIYVANYADGTVTTINGANHATATITAGVGPIAVAVNQVTNAIYVANYESGTVTAIDAGKIQGR